MFYDQYYLNKKLENTLLSRWNKLKPSSDLMFKVKYEIELKILLQYTITTCESGMSYITIFIKIYEKKDY